MNRKIAEELPIKWKKGGCLVGLFLLAAASTGCLDTSLPELDEVVPTVDADGVVTVDRLGIKGQWYAYLDRDSCTEVGRHGPEVCSSLASGVKSLPDLGLAQPQGKLCVQGKAAKLVRCCDAGEMQSPTNGECEAQNDLNCYATLDYSNLWGAGIGFDFRLPDESIEEGERSGEQAMKRRAWNAEQYGVVGISFELDWFTPEEPKLRVEFPLLLEGGIELPPQRGTRRLTGERVQAGEELAPDGKYSTEEHPYGSPYWQDPNRRTHDTWSDSPVNWGYNEVLLEQVLPPPRNDEFNYFEWDQDLHDSGGARKLLGMQIHVVPDEQDKNEEPQDFGFCISNLKFLISNESR